MNRLERRLERDLRQIADRASPSPDAWNSIITRIADQGPDTETEIILLTEATPRSRRWLSLAAAAVVAVIAVTGIAFAISRDDESPSPAATTVAPDTVAPPPTVAPTTIAPTMETVSFAVTTANIPVTFTVPAEWIREEDPVAYAVSAHTGSGAGEVGLSFNEIPNIYADGCQWVPLDPPVGPTVDDLAEAWANLPDFAATPAVDVTVDGYAGKRIEFTVPDYNIGECQGADSKVFGLWTSPTDAFPYGAQGPNQHTEQRIVDVDGTRLVITAYYVPSASPQDLADLEEALASIQIG
jgi:hypothetical protein